ncbi:KAP family P-loop domain-containing protein [Paraburkholderia phenazinium]|uniref:KAP family P-loop domain-containing protein n=2 Tax=Paraburkholderia phenazinium TaxID=60549 RepID=A0A1N6EC84_9BURK|nr:KAP family P-loop domain-containing protein [Paraburkholderia phenazinium]
MMPSKANPKLLPDVPHLDDRLGGAHKQLAESITKLILTSDGGKSIKLDGFWGSGKSTVVGMLTKLLERLETGEHATRPAEEYSTLVFQYDAWVHVGDPLRRAFMTSLLMKLSGAKWIDFTNNLAKGGRWERELAKLSKRLKVSSKTVHPNFDDVSKLILGGLIALGIVAPTAFGALSDALRDWDAGARLSFAGAAWLVLTGFFYFSSGRMLNIVVKRAANAETTETIEEAEPTSIEFQGAFGTLLGEVLKKESRRLVIVVDNLDRIDEKEASDIWTLLRSFLDNPSFAAEPWFKRLWVVVPLASSRTSESDGNRRAVADSGLSNFDKIFQVSFTVPPPLLHSWKNYLAELLEKVFGKDDTGDHDEILRLYEEIPPPGRMTPRAIVTFVNRLVAAKVEWDDAVPLSCLAAYELCAPKLDVSSCQPPEVVARILPIERLNDVFAMLHYRASSLDDASYLTISPEIEKALDAGDSKQLRELLKRTPSGRYVLDKYVRSDLKKLGSQQERLFQFLCALAPLCKEENADSSEPLLIPASLRRHLVEAACQTLSETSSLHLRNDNLVSGIDAFLSIVANDARSASVVVKLLAGMKASSEQDGNGYGTIWERWKDNFTLLLARKNIREYIEQTGFKFTLPVSPTQWAEVVQCLQKSDQTWALQACSSEQSVETLIEWVTSGLDQYLVSDAARALLKQLANDNGEPVVKAFMSSVAQKISLIANGNPTIQPPTIDVAASAISVMISDFPDHAFPPLRTLTRNTSLFSYIAAAQSQNQLACKFVFCIAAYLGLEKEPMTPGKISSTAMSGQQAYVQTMQGNAVRAPSDVSAYCDVLSGLQRFDLLPDLVGNTAYAALGKQLVIGLASDKRFIEMLTSGVLDANEFAVRYIPVPDLRKAYLEALPSSFQPVPDVS